MRCLLMHAQHMRARACAQLMGSLTPPHAVPEPCGHAAGQRHPQYAQLDSPALWAGAWNQLCVTCRVVRPLRAKHCAVSDRCVHMFDHFCPWVRFLAERTCRVHTPDKAAVGSAPGWGGSMVQMQDAEGRPFISMLDRITRQRWLTK